MPNFGNNSRLRNPHKIRMKRRRASLERAIESDATRIGSYDLLAELLIRQLNLPNEGRSCIEKMVKANPSNAEAYLIRAHLERSLNRFPESLQDVDRLLALDPENADGLLMIADLMKAKGDVAKARIALTDGLAIYQKDLRFYRELSFLELSSGNIPVAIACLDQGVRLMPNAIELLAPLGDLLVQQGEVDRAKEILQALKKRNAMPTQIKYLEGRLLMQQAQWGEALVTLEDLRKEVVGRPGLEAQVNVLLANCHERLGNRQAQEEALRRVVTIDAGHLGAHLKFAENQLSAGNLDEAIKEYTVAARSSFAPLSARIALGRLLIARARGSNTASEWSVVSDYINQLREKYKNTVDPILLGAEMLMARQQYAEARTLLRNEAGKRVNDARIWSVLAAIALEAHGMHAAFDVLDEAQELIGNQVELRLARARTWTVDWKPGREKRVRALGQNIGDLSDAEQYRLLSGLADVCATIRDLDGVRHFQTQLAARSPRDLNVRKALYESAVRAGDLVAKEKIGGEIVALADESIIKMVNALIESDTPNITPARREALKLMATKAIELTPDRGDPHLLLAKLAQQTGDRRTAAKELAKAIELEPSQFSYLEEQIAFLLRDGDPTTARKRIEQLYLDPRLSGEGFLGLIDGATAKLPTESFDRCMTWIEPLVKKSAVSMCWMARLQKGQGRTEQAAALLTRASQESPTSIDAWIVRAYLQPATVQETLKAAKTILNERSWLLLCAETADVVRQRDPNWTPSFEKPEQRRWFAQACLDAAERRDQLAEANAVLDRLIADGAARPEDVAWAKRQKSMLAAGRGTNVERRQAALAIKEMPPAVSDNLEDCRSRVAALNVAARQLHGEARRAVLMQAIESMKRIVADKSSSAKDWYNLSQFQRLAGKQADYRTSLGEAMKRDEGNLFYTAAYVDDLLNDGKITEAEAELPRLLLGTHDLFATSTVARYYALANLPARSIEVVEQYINAADVGTPEGQSRVRHAAEMLDRIARAVIGNNRANAKILLEAALDKYRISLKAYPESATLMASLLAFDGRVTEAFDLLASMKSSIAIKSLTTTSVDLLRNGNASAKNVQTTKEWLDAALAHSPASCVLKLNLADFYALRQDYAHAEPIYAEVLKIEPDNLVALNNLAYMLAPRPDATEQALKYVDRAIEVNGPTGELLDTRARVYIARGDMDKAVDDLTLAIEQAPTSLRYFHLALRNRANSKSPRPFSRSSRQKRVAWRHPWSIQMI